MLTASEQQDGHLYVKGRRERGIDVAPQGSSLLPAPARQVSIGVLLVAYVVEAFCMTNEVYSLRKEATHLQTGDAHQGLAPTEVA